MQHRGVTNYVKSRSARTCIRFVRPEDKSPQSRTNERTGTHRTRFEGDSKGAVGEPPPVPIRTDGRLDGQDFGMGGGVLVSFAAIGAVTKFLPVRSIYDGPHRDVVTRRAAGNLKCAAHVVFVAHESGFARQGHVNPGPGLRQRRVQIQIRVQQRCGAVVRRPKVRSHRR